jgi:hypothetical protein
MVIGGSGVSLGKKQEKMRDGESYKRHEVGDKSCELLGERRGGERRGARSCRWTWRMRRGGAWMRTRMKDKDDDRLALEERRGQERRGEERSAKIRKQEESEASKIQEVCVTRR